MIFFAASIRCDSPRGWSNLIGVLLDQYFWRVLRFEVRKRLALLTTLDNNLSPEVDGPDPLAARPARPVEVSRHMMLQFLI